MTRTPSISSSSGITPFPPEPSGVRKVKETKIQRTAKDKAIEKLGLQREQSGRLSHQKLTKKVSKEPPLSSTRLPGRIPRERTEAFLPKPEEQGTLRRKGPPLGGVRVMFEQTPPLLPPRTRQQPPAPPPAYSSSSSSYSPPSSPSAYSSSSSSHSPTASSSGINQPLEEELEQELGEVDVNTLSDAANPPLIEEEEEILPLLHDLTSHPSTSHTKASASIDRARQIFGNPKAVEFLGKTEAGRQVLLNECELLMRSSFVSGNEANAVLNAIIGVQTKARIEHETTRGRSGSDIEPLTEKEMAQLNQNIKRYHDLEKREPASAASRYKGQTHFEHNATNAPQLGAAIEREHALRSIPPEAIRESLEKSEARQGFYQRIVDATGGYPLIWINQHMTDPQQKIAAIRFLNDLQGDGRIRIRDAKVLLDALRKEQAINQKTKNELGKGIDRVKTPIQRFEPGDLNLGRNLRTLRNVYNELIETEKRFITPLGTFLEPMYVPRDAAGRKIKDENNHTVKLNYFEALKHKGIITEEESQYFQRTIRQIIESSNSQFAQLQQINEDFTDLPQAMNALMEATSPAALYELTQSLSKIGEKYRELLEHINEQQKADTEQKALGNKHEDIGALFRKAEGRVAPNIPARGVEALAITPVQRAPRYVLLFRELRKEMDKLGMEEAVQSIDERMACLEACTRWANWKTPK